MHKGKASVFGKGTSSIRTWSNGEVRIAPSEGIDANRTKWFEWAY